MEIRKELVKLENEKQDFDSYMDLEREKFKRRESELKDQLEHVYSEQGLPSPVALGDCTEISLLQAKITDLQSEVIQLFIYRYIHKCSADKISH